MSIDSTNKEWIILLSSFVFSMDMIVIPLLFIFFIIYIGDCLEKL
ncbi:putative membrane protein [Escherichia coli 3-105-05_S4_C2]|nr:putative membrane protein [Escherichia coli 3-105-05_S4_C2]